MIDPLTGEYTPDIGGAEWPPSHWMDGGAGDNGIITILQDGSEPPGGLRADAATPDIGTVPATPPTDLATVPDFAKPEPIPTGMEGEVAPPTAGAPGQQYAEPIGPERPPGYVDPSVRYPQPIGPAEPPGLVTPDYLERRYAEAQTPGQQAQAVGEYYNRLSRMSPEAQSAAYLLHEQRRNDQYNRGMGEAIDERGRRIDTAQRRYDQAMAQVDEMWKKNMQEAQLLAQTHVDPDRYKKKQGIVGNILDGVASVFGSVLAVHNGGRNTIVEQIQKDIDRDIESQVRDLQSRRDSLHTSNGMVADLMRRGYDMKQAADIATQAKFEQRAMQLSQERARFDPAGTSAFALLQQEQAMRAKAQETARKQHQQDFENRLKVIGETEKAWRRDKFNPGGVGTVGIDPTLDLPYINRAAGGGGGLGGAAKPTGLVDPNSITSDSIVRMMPQLDARGRPVIGKDGKPVMVADTGINFDPKVKGALDSAEKLREAVNAADQANYIINAIDKRGYGRDALMNVRKALNNADSTMLQMDLANYYKQRSEGDAARLATVTGGDLNAMAVQIWDKLGPNERKAVMHRFRDNLNRRTTGLIQSYDKRAHYDPSRLPPSPNFDEEDANKDLSGYSDRERREGVANVPILDPEKGKGINPAATPKPGQWPRNAAGDYGTEGELVDFIDSLGKVDVEGMPGWKMSERRHAAAEQYLANDKVLREKELEIADAVDPLKNPDLKPAEVKQLLGVLKRIRATREKIRKMAPNLAQPGVLPEQ